ncbi:deoxyribodipyrimidine photo-lyase-like [Drosophila guanche]|uniref:Deoxyribodipyrimidine photo-lyase n=1 Tax=Drosophila guanche TaxID=7266 RepID=A0A3B0J6V3_DROGU|nr:deoxyribodipyrimidine photo-lyase-like [Drosophila guanche]SPP75572.1 blast:Ubiquitin-like modifier-activating enzyme ATG7 [Drosophila guanche]
MFISSYWRKIFNKPNRYTVGLNLVRRLASIYTMKRTKTGTAGASKKAPKKEKKSAEPEEAASGSSGDEAVASSSKLAQSKPEYKNFDQFLAYLEQQRCETAASVQEFPFKKKRVRVLSKANDVGENCPGGVVYWMLRDARVQDNWALLFAQRLALKLELPLAVVFCLVPKFLNANIRHYKFMMGGLQEVEQQCRELGIPFHVLLGSAVDRLPEFVRSKHVGAVVCDFSPLRGPRKWVEDVAKALPKNVPLTQVDAHNVVPLWVTSDKQEYAARTIRNKINSKLGEFLSDFPPVIKHPHGEGCKKVKPIDWPAAYAMLECDMDVDEVQWAKPGYKAACLQLYEFCSRRLGKFNDKRNDPTVDALSGLSPWLHFGQISAQRCALEVQRYRSQHKASADAFCEEAIVRRELADNFCYYNENYDNLKGLSSWALQSLEAHRKDKRDPCYTLEELEQSLTYDDLWNSAQLQLVREGKMHGFLRMYWAKKILEWTATPEQALEYSILLNDKYSLDGRDPNGYVGCMWSIGGVHDMGWKERAIFGKIRYMNYQGCKRKFDVNAFVMRYGGKVHK